jgi:hypothetical protein
VAKSSRKKQTARYISARPRMKHDSFCPPEENMFVLLASFIREGAVPTGSRKKKRPAIFANAARGCVFPTTVSLR